MPLPVIPILGAVAPLVIDEVAELISRKKVHVTKEDVTDVVVAGLNAAAADPKIKNDLNGESLFRSRVAWGTAGATVMAAAIVYDKWQRREFDQEFGIALAALISAAYGFLGRVKSWSGPMFSRLLGR